ncbi:hypothetical protein J6590_097663 [Homalodisca vitripennis]|nr:hypothetical protein J6590_097663 [Homalodisca vitripennis]
MLCVTEITVAKVNIHSTKKQQLLLVFHINHVMTNLREHTRALSIRMLCVTEITVAKVNIQSTKKQQVLLLFHITHVMTNLREHTRALSIRMLCVTEITVAKVNIQSTKKQQVLLLFHITHVMTNLREHTRALSIRMLCVTEITVAKVNIQLTKKQQVLLLFHITHVMTNLREHTRALSIRMLCVTEITVAKVNIQSTKKQLFHITHVMTNLREHTRALSIRMLCVTEITVAKVNIQSTKKQQVLLLFHITHVMTNLREHTRALSIRMLCVTEITVAKVNIQLTKKQQVLLLFHITQLMTNLREHTGALSIRMLCVTEITVAKVNIQSTKKQQVLLLFHITHVMTNLREHTRALSIRMLCVTEITVAKVNIHSTKKQQVLLLFLITQLMTNLREHNRATTDIRQSWSSSHHRGAGRDSSLFLIRPIAILTGNWRKTLTSLPPFLQPGRQGTASRSDCLDFGKGGLVVPGPWRPIIADGRSRKALSSALPRAAREKKFEKYAPVARLLSGGGYRTSVTGSIGAWDSANWATLSHFGVDDRRRGFTMVLRFRGHHVEPRQLRGTHNGGDVEDTIEETVNPKKKRSYGRTPDASKMQKAQSFELGEHCLCKRFKCFEVIPRGEQKRILHNFNEIGAISHEPWNAQSSHLAGLICVMPIKRRSYRVRISTGTDERNQDVQLCQKAFMPFHSTIEDSLKEFGISPKDKRGPHKNRDNHVWGWMYSTTLSSLSGIKDGIRNIIATQLKVTLYEN